MTLILVALGGALGASLRYAVGTALAVPFGTLFVNVAGSFAMGLAFVWLSAGEGGTMRWHVFIMTGLLGGFTTFSAFSLDAMRLLQSGHMTQALLYIAGSVGLSLAALMLGIAAARAFA